LNYPLRLPNFGPIKISGLSDNQRDVGGVKNMDNRGPHCGLAWWAILAKEPDCSAATGNGVSALSVWKNDDR